MNSGIESMGKTTILQLLLQLLLLLLIEVEVEVEVMSRERAWEGSLNTKVQSSRKDARVGLVASALGLDKKVSVTVQNKSHPPNGATEQGATSEKEMSLRDELTR